MAVELDHQIIPLPSPVPAGISGDAMWTNTALPAIYAANYRGFPLTPPTSDPVLVRDQLQYFHGAYPNQLFVLDSSNDDDNMKVVVSWIPDWYTPILIGSLFSQAIIGSFSPYTAMWPNK
jgi:hypothetical protein